MTRLGLALLRSYLAFFALFASNRAHARHEHGLIEGSLRESYAAQRRSGRSRVRSFATVAWEHLGELSPLAMIRKTRTDAAFAARPGRPSRWPEVLVLALGALLLVAVWRNRGDGDPLPVALGAIAVAAAIAFLFSVVGALRRSVGAPAIILALGLAIWPLWGWRFSMLEGLVSLAVVVALLIVLIVRRHRRSGVDGLGLLATAPLVLHLLRELRPSVGLEWVLGLTPGEIRGAELLLGLAVYFALLALGLRLIGHRHSVEPARPRAS